MSAPWLTLAAVLAASLIGSLHCVGMCGGFVASVSGACRVPGQPRTARAFGPLLAYQAARGVAYASLGALAGLLGAGLDASAAIVGVQRVAGPLMGVVLIAMALTSLRGRSTTPTSSLTTVRGKARRPSSLDRLRLALAKSVREHGATAGAAAGLLTALLPCGWLWAYLAVAASTGSVGGGSLVMAAFWLGSVPALLGVGLLAGELGRRLGRHAPRITAALLLGLGVASLVGKLSLAPKHEQLESHPESQPATVEPVALPHDAPCH